MTGHGSHTLHFVLNERCLVRPTWLESRWIQWDQRAAELSCSFQRPTGSPPIPPPPATPCHFLTSNVGGLLLGKTRRKHLAARMNALLLLRSRALCQCSGAARRPRQRCQSESALHLVLINTACTSLSGYHELTEADVVLMPAGFLHA